MVISLVKTVVDNASVKQLMHFLQLIRSGTFQHFDYGREKNKLYYNNENPPAYNMSLLEVPLICISLTKDAIVTQEVIYNLPNILFFVFINNNCICRTLKSFFLNSITLFKDTLPFLEIMLIFCLILKP